MSFQKENHNYFSVMDCLRLAFRVILEEGDEFLAGNLVTIMLERSGLLFGAESFQNSVRK